MTTVALLTIEMAANIARLQADMNQAKSVVNSSMQSITQAVELAKKAMVALAGVATVGAFVQMIKGSIESAAALHDLSIQTGATVEALSGLAAIGKYSDQSAESIGNAMNKLAKNMAGATEESKGTGKALEAIGINFADFKNLKPEEQMQVAAKAMEGFADGSGKSAVAMALYGKEGAKMLPFLKDLASAGEIHAKVTSEQAAMADDFSDNLLRLKSSGEAWKKELALGMLPALNLGVQAFVDVTNGSNGLRDGVRKLSADGSLKEWTRSAIAGLTYVLDAFAGVKRVVLTVGESIGAVAAMIADSFGAVGESIGKALRGDFAGALQASQQATARQKTMWADLKASVNTMWTEDTTGQKIRARMAELDALGVTAQGVKPKLDFANVLAGNTKAATESDKAFQSLMKTISEHAAVSQAELDGGEKLTTGQKLYAKAMDDVASGTLKLNSAQKDLLDTALKSMLATERASIAYTEQTKALHALAAENYKRVEAYEKTVATMGEQNKSLKDEIEMMGLNARGQLELTRARNAAVIALKQAQLAQMQNPVIYTKEQAALEEEIRLLQERNGLLGDKAALEESKNSFKSVWESVDKTAHDVFTNIFEGGQDLWSKLKNTGKSIFFDWLYQMTLKKWVFSATMAVTGTSAGVASAATGGTMDALNGASTLGNIASLGSSIVTVGGQVAAGTMSLANALGTLGANATGTGISGLLMTNGAYGTAVGGGSGMMAAFASNPYGWIALAAIAAYAVFSSKDPASESTGDTTANYNAAGVRTGSHAGFGFENAQTSAAADALQASYAGMAKSLGIGAVDTTFGTGGNSDGKTSHFAVGSSAGGKGYHSADNLEYSDAAYKLEAARAVFSALQGSELPKYLAGAFDDITASSATQEQITAALNGAQALKQFHDQLQLLPFENLKDMSYQATRAMIAASGSLENVGANMGVYLDKFYSEGEKAALGTANLTAQFAAMGETLPATYAGYRALMDAQDLNTTAGQNMAAMLIALAPAFDSAASAAAAAAQRMSSLMADYASAEEQRAFSIEQIRKGLADGGVNLSADQIGSATRDQAWAFYKDAIASGNQQQADAIANQLGAFARITAATNAPSTTGGIGSGGGGGGGGGSSGASAADSIKSAWKSITDSIWGEVKRIRGLLEGTGADAYAAAKDRFAIATSRAPYDQDAAKALPQLSQAMLTLAEDNTSTLIELQRIRAQTAASLATTNTVISAKYGTSIPAYASGGLHSGGWAMVGEQGPELAYMPPARIYNAADTRAMQGGGQSNAELADALRRMADRLDAIETNTRNTDKNTGKAKDVLVRVTQDGQAMQTEPV